MRRFEMFDRESKLIDRVHFLLDNGYENEEIFIYSNKALSQDVKDHENIHEYNQEDDSIVDTITSIFSDDDNDEEDVNMFEEYNWDDQQIQQANEAIDNNQYILVVKNDQYYEDEGNFNYIDDQDDPYYEKVDELNQTQEREGRVVDDERINPGKNPHVDSEDQQED